MTGFKSMFSYRSKAFATFFAVAIGIVLLVGSGYFSGRLVKDSKRWPFAQINSLADSLLAPIRDKFQKPQKVQQPRSAEPTPAAKGVKNSERNNRRNQNVTLASIFFPIDGAVTRIPKASRPGVGGGLTSIHENLVLLNHAGQIYNILPNGGVQKLKISPPSNGFLQYMDIVSTAESGDYQHNPRSLRYNDILYMENDGRRFLLVSFTKFHPEQQCYTTTVSRLEIPSTVSTNLLEWTFEATDWVTLFEASPCLPLKKQWRAIEGHMAGGRIVSAGDGSIYLANGDYAWDGMYGPRSLDTETGLALSQDPDVDYGKVISINVLSGEAEHISLGHRNVQGITLDHQGRLWTVEHGMRGGDELNQVKPGLNFGWPLESYGTTYAGTAITGAVPDGKHESYARPIFAFLPSIATSGIAAIKGFHDAWDGDLLISTLSGQKLVRVRIREGRAVFAEDIPAGFRIRYVLQHSDGRVVLWTDDRRVIFLSPAKGGQGFKLAKYLIEHEMGLSEAQKKALLAALDGCMECHSLNEQENFSGPSLARVYGSRMGSQSYDGYSGSMAGREESWNAVTLLEFLGDPQAIVPGTTMPATGLTEQDVRTHLVELLRLLDATVEIPSEFR